LDQRPSANRDLVVELPKKSERTETLYNKIQDGFFVRALPLS
jgi:hypothetical protein